MSVSREPPRLRAGLRLAARNARKTPPGIAKARGLSICLPCSALRQEAVPARACFSSAIPMRSCGPAVSSPRADAREKRAALLLRPGGLIALWPLRKLGNAALSLPEPSAASLPQRPRPAFISIRACAAERPRIPQAYRRKGPREKKAGRSFHGPAVSSPCAGRLESRASSPSRSPFSTLSFSSPFFPRSSPLSFCSLCH